MYLCPIPRPCTVYLWDESRYNHWICQVNKQKLRGSNLQWIQRARLIPCLHIRTWSWPHPRQRTPASSSWSSWTGINKIVMKWCRWWACHFSNKNIKQLATTSLITNLHTSIEIFSFNLQKIQSNYWKDFV